MVILWFRLDFSRFLTIDKLINPKTLLQTTKPSLLVKQCLKFQSLGTFTNYKTVYTQALRKQLLKLSFYIEVAHSLRFISGVNLSWKTTINTVL